MKWFPGTPVTFSADDTPQQLTSTPGLVAGIRFRHAPGNSNRIFYGTSGFSPVTGSGVLGYRDAPIGGKPRKPEEFDDTAAFDLGQGIDPTTVYVAGKAGEAILWSYKE